MDNKTADCCKKGSEFIKWFLTEFDYANHDLARFSGWGMMVDAACYHDGYDYNYTSINFCPFCGCKLKEEIK